MDRKKDYDDICQSEHQNLPAKKLEVLFQGMKSYIPQLDIPMQTFDDRNKIYFV